MVKRVLTWKLTNGYAHDSVQALVGFNSEGEALGAKAICYLSHAKSSDTADVVVVALNGALPEMKYRGKKQPSKKQLIDGELASQKKRSSQIGYQVERTE